MSTRDIAKAVASGRPYPEELAGLGFPAAAIDEAVRAYDRGLFELDPSPDLLHRTMKRCREALARPVAVPAAELPTDPQHIADVLAAYYMAVTDLDDVLAGINPRMVQAHALASFGQLASECLATVGFVQSTRERPVMLVDNHNLKEPAWWESDTGFVAMREALATVNCAALEVSAPPSAVVMVLRANVDDYAQKDIEAIGSIVTTATSDVWMVPLGRAGMYEKKDIVVFGDEQVLSLRERFATPVAALSAFRPDLGLPVREARASIEALTEHAAEFRQRDVDADEIAGMRSLLREVIECGRPVRVFENECA